MPVYNRLVTRTWELHLRFKIDRKVTSSATLRSIVIKELAMAELARKIKHCAGVDCPNEAGSLQCPTCLKLGIESFFCSQDCFKKSWVGFLIPL